MAKPSDHHTGRVAEVFKVFLSLGLTSFGGPVAHLGYFRDALVTRRRWLSEERYAELVGLCQFLPGPASSQVGFALGWHRAGPAGALAAWLAFTMPSALLLLTFAWLTPSLDNPWSQSALQGLKLLAVAVVAQAILGMARSLCPDVRRSAIALAAMALVLLSTAPWMQLVVIALGASLGSLFCRYVSAGTQPIHLSVRPLFSRLSLLLFFALLLGLPLLSGVTGQAELARADAYYRSGAMVFGGGHVVLPLLEEQIVEPAWVSQDAFLAGYGAAQAVPGPLFTLAAYLGGMDSGLGGAAIALLAIFLPGMLLLVGVLPHWQRLRRWSLTVPMMAGANAAVVGLLAAAFYQPVWRTAVLEPIHFFIVTTAFIALSLWRWPVLAVIGLCVAASIGGHWLGLS